MGVGRGAVGSSRGAVGSGIGGSGADGVEVGQWEEVGGSGEW